MPKQTTLEKAKLALAEIICDPELTFDETIAALKAVLAEAKRLLDIADVPDAPPLSALLSQEVIDQCDRT